MWLVALCFYTIAAATDVAFRLDAERRAGQVWLTSANVAVAFSAGLFWPVDLVARGLIGR